MFSLNETARKFPVAAKIAVAREAKHMHSIEKSAGQVIASDTQDAVDAVNQAILSYAGLCSSIIEVSRAANLPAMASQPALGKMSAGIAALVEGRKEIVGAARDLLKVQKASSLDAVSFGCPDGFPTRDNRVAAKAEIQPTEC